MREESQFANQTEEAQVNLPRVVPPAEWEVARENLLVKEKAATRARDALAAERRKLPIVQISMDYVLEGPDGTASLLDLFDGRRQPSAHGSDPASPDPDAGHDR